MVHYRKRLSQLLFKLLSDASVHQVGAQPRGPDLQRQALRQAACSISLGGDLRLSKMLAINLGGVNDLARRITTRRIWPKGRGPHRVLVFVAWGFKGDTLVAVRGDRIAVRRAIGVLGLGQKVRRHDPFIATVVVGSPDVYQPIAPRVAYARRACARGQAA